MTLSRSPIKKGDVSSWNFPSFAESTSIDIEIGNVKVPTAGDLEKLQEQALQEASKRGYEDGFSKGIKALSEEDIETIKSIAESNENLISEISVASTNKIQLANKKIKAIKGYRI